MTCEHGSTCEHCSRIEGERDGYKVSIAFLHEREREYINVIRELMGDRDRLVKHLEAYTRTAIEAARVIQDLEIENLALRSVLMGSMNEERIEA